MKTVLSLLLVTLFGSPVFGEDLKVYAAAAFKSPLVEMPLNTKPRRAIRSRSSSTPPAQRKKSFATILERRC